MLGNSLLDSTIRNGNDQSYDWNGDWIGSTKINNNNWVSEIFIPWSIGNMLPITGKRTIKFGAFRYTAFDGNLVGTAKTHHPSSRNYDRIFHKILRPLRLQFLLDQMEL